MVDRDDIKRRVLEATDIVRLIEQHVSLRARGREFVGLCPFHDDKRPSMCVVPAKQIFKCFSCGAGGDAFSFMTRYHGMTFPEALNTLAEQASIEVPRYSKTDGEPASARAQVLKANELAASFYQRQLADDKAGADARAYLTKRGVNDEMIEAFRIGYAPDGWEGLSKTVKAHKHDPRAFTAADVLRTRDDGSTYDRFRHRLMFPIIDGMNRTIAFGGRKLREEDEPKYLNSGETAAFDKSSTLFGMHRAQRAILESRTAVIVEGYTDVIAAHQAGFSNVVATLGTALTEKHAKQLRRYADQVVLIFDADEAGQKAADRAVSVFFTEPIDVRIAVLPDGLDPADLLSRENGPAEWQQAIDDGSDALVFQFARVRKAYEAATTIAAKTRLTEDYLRTLTQLGLGQIDAARRGLVLASVADLLRLDVPAVEQIMRQMGGKRRAPAHVEEPGEMEIQVPFEVDAGRRGPTAAAERHLVGALLNCPALLHAQLPDGTELGEAVVPADLGDDAVSRVYAALYDWLLDAEHDSAPEAPLGASDLRELLPHEHLLQLALDLQIEVDRLAESDAESVVVQAIDAAESIRRHRGEMEYRRQKMQQKEKTDQPSADAGADELARRLELTKAYMNANPNSARIVRPAGSS